MSAKNKRNQDDLGTNSAGQSGDTQQISDVAGAHSESVAELVEEGNAFEADAIDGVENAKDPDVSEVTTREVPEDDVPQEYLDDDEHVA
jgi:N utilization substance protein A